MNLSAEFTVCLIDGVTIDISPAYRMLQSLHGKEFADSFTRIETIPLINRHPPPEVKERDEHEPITVAG